jgi:hypothetical protein
VCSVLFIGRVDVLVPGDVGGRRRRERHTHHLTLFILTSVVDNTYVPHDAPNISKQEMRKYNPKGANITC